MATAIGDGGTSEGDFAEGLNFAAAFAAPVVFLVQNNRDRQMKNRFVAERAAGFDVPAVVVDGNEGWRFTSRPGGRSSVHGRAGAPP